MKNKKALVLLIALSLIQLLFPVSLLVYEDIMMDKVIEKGQSYTLDYTQITHFNKAAIGLDTDEIYTVGYRWDYKNREDGYIPHDTVSVYSKVGIREKEDGSIEFFDTEGDGELTKYNWFHTYDALRLRLDEYEFVRADFGMKELFEAGLYLSEDTTNDTTFEKFMQSEDGYYNGIWHIPFEGRITLKVYNGFAKISEFYIGDELVLRYK